MAQARTAALLKGRLGAALALGAAAAVPTVVASSETPPTLPSGPWYGACDGNGDTGTAAHASAAAWPVSRVVEQLLQTPLAAGSEPGAAAAPAAAATPAGTHESAASEEPGHMLSERGPSGRQQLKFRRAGGTSASNLAAQHQPELQHTRQLAVAELARLCAGSEGSTASHQQLPPRFTDAELMRFCCMHGLLRAGSPAERQAALRDGAAAAARTAHWLRDHTFASEEELLRFAHLISWKGTDSAGRPMLVIHIGQAVSECRGGAAVAFANATITQVERCVQQQLPWDGGSEGAPAGSSASALAAGSSAPSSSKGNDEGDAAPPEQIVVVMDCSGASTLNAARISWVFQSVAATLNKHYPGRLHELVLLELPVMLGWMVKGVKKLVHPETRHKFRVVPQGSQPAPTAEACSADGSSSISPGSVPAPLRLPLGQQQASGVQQGGASAGAGAA
ncbi:hypothetical protein D9Q98_010160 [Chlorella vulgaris]|uniref:CRAL-TRIO domain-containing protein n=1 Tax=Chlorella vulgaris TaxID=3077 RepID=A0A9D4YWF6_CHLVU|nr:hypothetical protein D9Q98_010160 [Chlorella vulgaris]